MHDERSSVRIEVDTGETSSPAQPTDPRIEQSKPRRPWLPVALGAFLVVALVAALVALQPGDGQDATGTERAAPTTAPSTTAPGSPTTTTVASASADAAVLGRVLNVGEVVTPTFAAGSVVRGNSSWIGVDSGESQGSLVVSSDGVEWATIETGVEGLLDYGRFSNLIETEDGFGALIGLTDGSGLLQRVNSPNGEEWRIEPDFNLGTPISERITAHTGELVAVANFESTFDRFLELLESSLNSPQILDGLQMCGAERSFEELQLTDCDGLGSPRLTGEDLIDSTMFNAIANCAIELADTTPAGSTSLFWSGSEPVVVGKHILRSPVELPDGRVAMIHPGSGAIEGSAPCDGLIGSISEPPPTIVIASPDGEIQFIEIEQEILIEPQMVRGIHGLNVVAGSSIWNLDPATEQWSELYRLSDAILSGSEGVALVPGRAESLELINGHVWVVDIATGRGRLHGVDLPADPSPSVLSIDSTWALISADSTLLSRSLQPLRVATSR